MDKYEALEGRRVKYWRSDDRFVWAIVANIDPDVGITVVEEDDHKFNCLCLVGPSSSIWQKNWNRGNYKKRFKTIHKQIKKGEINTRQSGGNLYSDSVPQELCPFNQ